MDTPHGTMVSDYHSLTREAVVKLLEQRDAELKVKDADTRIFEDPLRKQAADCFADASLLADIITAKFAYHQPEYRQCSRWKQHDINIPTSTVNHWVPQCRRRAVSTLQAPGEADFAESLPSG
ncbi:MAG: transposase [Segatella oris]